MQRLLRSLLVDIAESAKEGKHLDLLIRELEP